VAQVTEPAEIQRMQSQEPEFKTEPFEHIDINTEESVESLGNKAMEWFEGKRVTQKSGSKYIYF